MHGEVNVFVACCSGQSPGEAELRYLENAKNMALYGVHMHEAVVSASVVSLRRQN